MPCRPCCAFMHAWGMRLEAHLRRLSTCSMSGCSWNPSGTSHRLVPTHCRVSRGKPVGSWCTSTSLFTLFPPARACVLSCQNLLKPEQLLCKCVCWPILPAKWAMVSANVDCNLHMMSVNSRFALTSMKASKGNAHWGKLLSDKASTAP